MASQESTPPVRRRFGAGMVVLGVALAVNTLLGPLVAGAVDYPFTETVYNETLGLEAVSLALVAPLAVFAGLLSVAGRRAGPAIALGISAYTAYMMVQYVVGPQYPTYQPAVLLHLAIFVLAVALLLRAWTLEDGDLRGRSPRRWAGVVLAMGAFVVFRWLPALTGVAGNDPVPAEPADVTMYWAIFLLDLGLVVPAALATGVGLLRGASWSVTALYAVVGWFALVPRRWRR